MRLYNTYTNKIEELIPARKNEVSMYVCGPTVYNYAHIGNSRPIMLFDTIRKYLEHRGYKVKMASNFTDINEKILAKAKEEGIPEMEIAEKYINAYMDDVRFLGVNDDYIKPRVSENIQEIIDFIQILIDKGDAYVSDHDVYFRVAAIKEYGSLSNRKTDELIQGARVEVNEKKESGLDFALWKDFDEGITYDSPWGKGRPGWHTECCVMIEKVFGEEIDIHGGGSDLIFPHHENEIAQSVGAFGHRLSRFWVHNARLSFGGETMSKSLGNVIWIKDLKCDPRAFRLLVDSFPYRNIISYTEELQAQFIKEFDKLYQTKKDLFLYLDLNSLLDDNNTHEYYEKHIQEFDEAMDNDLNMPNALTVLNNIVKDVNIMLRSLNKDNDMLKDAYKALEVILHILGLDIIDNRMTKEDKDLYNKWLEARKNKDFNLADTFRKQLKEKGII